MFRPPGSSSGLLEDYKNQLYISGPLNGGFWGWVREHLPSSSLMFNGFVRMLFDLLQNTYARLFPVKVILKILSYYFMVLQVFFSNRVPGHMFLT
jgi:hypothetical protein